MRSSFAVAESAAAAKLVVGTAGLGLAYGLPAADGSRSAPDDAAAAAVVRAALDRGLTTFDTAPAYGEAERHLGLALGPAGEVWSKFDRRRESGPLAEALVRSLAASLARLRRPALQAFHWHNWTAAVGADPEFAPAWRTVCADPRAGTPACSTYGVEDALAAVESGHFRQVQVEANLLNRRVLRAIAGPARAAGVRIAVRSAYLQGVLTPKGEHLPAALAELAPARARCAAIAQRLGQPLQHLAVNALLADPDVAQVLIGIDCIPQLDDALAAARQPGVPTAVLEELAAGEPADAGLTDPRTWPPCA